MRVAALLGLGVLLAAVSFTVALCCGYVATTVKTWDGTSLGEVILLGWAIVGMLLGFFGAIFVGVAVLVMALDR